MLHHAQEEPQLVPAAWGVLSLWSWVSLPRVFIAIRRSRLASLIVSVCPPKAAIYAERIEYQALYGHPSLLYMLLISDVKWMAEAECQTFAFPCHLKGASLLLVWGIVCF